MRCDSELRRRRKQVGHLVEVARQAGIDQGALSRYERGLQGLTWGTARKLGAVLDLPPEDVIRLTQAAREVAA